MKGRLAELMGRELERFRREHPRSLELTERAKASLLGGVPMHWSRLVDIPLAGSILLLAPLIGQTDAELATLVLVPLLT